ncbi:MAG: hypothetical protein ACYCO0_04940 [Candidatus Micrarchaeaceae archaeon]
MATTTIRFMSVMAGLRQTRKRKKASDYLREHIARFNKSRPELVKIDPLLNQFIMTRSVHGGDSVKVEVVKSGDVLNVKLAPGQMAITTPEEPDKKPKQQQKTGAATMPKANAKPDQGGKEKQNPESSNKKAQASSQKPAKKDGA